MSEKETNPWFGIEKTFSDQTVVELLKTLADEVARRALLLEGASGPIDAPERAEGDGRIGGEAGSPSRR